MVATVSFILLCAAQVAGQSIILLDEPFDYETTAQVHAVWNAGGAPPDYYLDTGFGQPLPSLALPEIADNHSVRLARNLGGDYNATDARPLVLEYDFYLDPSGAGISWAGARQYVELRGYSDDTYGAGGLENVLAVGVYTSSSDPYDTTYYQGRVYGGVNWITLDQEAGAPLRSAGWHRMEIWITGAEVAFHVDGILCETTARPNNFGFDCVLLGSGLQSITNDHDTWVDNVRVTSFDMGACCLPDSTCEVMSMEDCQTAGGSYQGTGTDCDPTPCDCVGDLNTAGNLLGGTRLYPIWTDVDGQCSRSISLIRRSEFPSCNPAIITHLAIEVVSAASVPEYDIEIRLNKTTATQAPTNYGNWTSVGTVVWSGVRTFSATGWSVFDIDDFVWDSGNLEIRWEALKVSGIVGPSFRNSDPQYGLEVVQTAFFAGSGCPSSGIPYYFRALYRLTFAAAPAGACCLADSVCEVMTPEECQLAGGAYQGDGTDCAPNPCVPADLTIDWYTVYAGGHVFSTTRGTLGLSATIGQPEAASTPMTGGTLSMSGGYVRVAEPLCPACPGDLNGDDFRNVTDFTLFAAAFGSQYMDPSFDPCADITGDGFINVTDFTQFASVFGDACP